MENFFLVGALALTLVACDRPDHQPREIAEHSSVSDNGETNGKARNLMAAISSDQSESENSEANADINSNNYFFWGQEEVVQTINIDNKINENNRMVSLQFTPQISREITIDGTEITFHKSGVYYFYFQSVVHNHYQRFSRLMFSFGGVSTTFQPSPPKASPRVNVNLAGIIQVTVPDQTYSVRAEVSELDYNSNPVGAKYDFETRSLSIFKIADL